MSNYRIVHIADTHFGKQLKKVNFAEVDQPYWVERFLERMDEVKPNMVVMAGDIFDVKMPSKEADALLDKLLEGLRGKGIKACLVPGNHDAAASVARRSGLMAELGIHIAGKLEKELPCISVPLEEGKCINFWLMPYMTPSAVNEVLGRKDIQDYNVALQEYLAVQPVDYNQLNVLVAHQNIMGGTEERLLCDPERSIGFSGEMDWHNLEKFDYVALGHIHAAQHIGKENIRFAGAPLQYDFSEEGRWRGFVVVDIVDKDNITITKEELPPLHQLVVMPPKPQTAATLEELIVMGEQLEDKEGKYIKVRIWYEEYSPESHKLLEEVYDGHLVETELVKQVGGDVSIICDLGESESVYDTFEAFYEQIKEEELTERQKKLIQSILDEQLSVELLDDEDEKNKTKVEAVGKEIYSLVESLLDAEEAE